MLSPQPGGHPGHRLPPAQRCVGQGHGIGLGGFQECTRRGPGVRMIDLGCRHDLGQRLIGVGQSTQRSCGAAPAVRRCGGNGVGHPGYRVRILLDLRRVDVGAGNAAREQAVAPGQRRYRLRGQGISQGFAFGANPVPCAHIRCRVPSPRPYRPDHDLVDCGRCPCATTILPLTRPDYSVVARRPTSPQGDYSLTLSSFGTTRIRRVDLVTTGLSSADFTGTLGGTVTRPLTG